VVEKRRERHEARKSDARILTYSEEPDRRFVARSKLIDCLLKQPSSDPGKAP